jgi:heat shock protein HslJ
MRCPRTTRTTLLASVVVAALALVAVGCGSSSGTSSSTTPPTTTPSGEGVDGAWTLTSYLSGGAQTPAATAPATLDLVDSGTFTGSTGCNRISGTWTGSADGAFTVTPGPTTLMACTDPAGQAQEQALTAGLPKVTDAVVDGTTLTMSDASGAALFTWTKGPDGLQGTYAVTGVNNGKGAVVSSAATEKATITFGTDGTVSGNTGCNSFSGTYDVDGSTLTINGDVAATMMACEADAQALEQQFLTALGNVGAWERSGQQITLSDAGGAAQLTLTAS